MSKETKVLNTTLVCVCKGKTHGELLKVIKEKNIKDLQSLKDFTEAGTCCRTCVSTENDSRNVNPYYLVNYFN